MSEVSDRTDRLTAAAEARGVAIEITEFPKGTRSAEDAAAAIGCTLGQIVKSLVFVLDGKPVVALVSGINQLDEFALAGVAGVAGVAEGGTVERADADTVREATGYAIGGVPPFGHTRDLPVYLDLDLLNFEVVWAAAGTPRTVFPIDPQDLLRVTAATVAPLARR